ncbi:hypothetical protein J6590_051178 [Homalodisca vitripennis]|nr:hypothetical protein J6590_051178 [Homalodisca vitripennis]
MKVRINPDFTLPGLCAVTRAAAIANFSNVQGDAKPIRADQKYRNKTVVVELSSLNDRTGLQKVHALQNPQSQEDYRIKVTTLER